MSVTLTHPSDSDGKSLLSSLAIHCVVDSAHQLTDLWFYVHVWAHHMHEGAQGVQRRALNTQAGTRVPRGCELLHMGAVKSGPLEHQCS